MRKTQIFSSFFLKIFAIVFMTLDHVGLLLKWLYPTSYDINIIHNILRGFGRIALPLFIFMIVEGVLHTKSIKKYMLRLGIIALIISIGILVITKVNISADISSIKGMGNIFLDLLLTALTIYLLKQPNNYKKLFILLPIAISIISFCIKCYETETHNLVYWYPYWLYMQYDWYSILLGVGFFYSYKLADSYLSHYSNQSGIEVSVLEENGIKRGATNIIGVLLMIGASLLLYAFAYIWPKGIYWDATAQFTAIFSGAFLLFYSGKRGYNAKWFKYFSYAYYPLSLIIIFIIYICIGG